MTDDRAPRAERRTLLVVAGAIVLAVGAGLLIGKAASYAELADSLRRAETRWLLLCLVGEVLAYVGYLVLYRETAAVDGGPRFSWADSLRIVAAGFGALVLATNAGTLAVDFWALRRAGAKDAFARVIAINTLEWAVLGGAAAAAGAALLLGVDGGAPVAAALPWLLVVPPCVAAALWITSSRRYERYVVDAGGRARRLLASCVRGVRLVRLAPWQAWGGTVVYWAGDLICLWGGLRAFGVELGVAALVLAYATGYVVAALPLPAGGAGGVDAAMTYALTLVGVPLAPALLGTFAYRLFNFWLPAVPALIALPTLRRIGRPGPAGT